MGIPERTAGAVATVLLHLPGLRYFMVKMGCHPAGRASMVAMLRRRSVGIIPEGIAGLFRGASRWLGPQDGSPGCMCGCCWLLVVSSVCPLHDNLFIAPPAMHASCRTSRRPYCREHAWLLRHVCCH